MARNQQRSPRATSGTPAPETAEKIDIDPAFGEDMKGGAALVTNEAPRATQITQYTEPAAYTGFEDMTADDLKIPFVVALQAQSPQALRGNPKFIEGAQASMLYNNLTNRLYDGAVGVPAIPVMRKREEIEWVPLVKGGGLVKRHDPNDPAIVKLRKQYPFGKAPIGDGNELVQSVKLYLRIQDPRTGEFENVIVPFVSTNMDAFKTFYSQCLTQRFPVIDKATGQPVEPKQTALYPMYAHRWRLKTKFATKGPHSWYKLDLVLDAPSFAEARIPQDDPQYVEAALYARLIAEGRIVEHDETAAMGDTRPADEIGEI